MCLCLVHKSFRIFNFKLFLQEFLNLIRKIYDEIEQNHFFYFIRLIRLTKRINPLIHRSPNDRT